MFKGVVDKITDVVEVFNAHIRTQGGRYPREVDTLESTQVSLVSWNSQKWKNTMFVCKIYHKNRASEIPLGKR